MRNHSKQWICTAVFLLVFFSVAFYGAADVWFEATVFSSIFLLSGILFFRDDFSQIAADNRRFLIPLIFLAVYSFIQGFSTLLIQHKFLEDHFFLSFSFDLTGSFRSGLKILALAGFFCLFFVALRRNFSLTVLCLLAVGNLFAVFGIARFLLQAKFPETFQSFILPQLVPYSGFGTFLNRNHFALLMLMTFGLNIGLFWFGKFDKHRRIFLLILSLITFSATVLTASRGGIIGLFTVIGVSMMFAGTKKRDGLSSKTKGILSFGKNLLIFGFIALILIVGVVLIGQDRVLHRFEELPTEVEEDFTSQSYRRMDVWKAGNEIIYENPLYGAGFGGFRYAVSRYLEISGRKVPFQAHNDYLELIISGGLIAVIFVAWFLYFFISVLKARFRESNNRFIISAKIGAICGMSGAALHSFFDFGLQFTGNTLFFTALTAISVYSFQEKKSEQEAVETGLNKNLPNRYRSPFRLFLLNSLFWTLTVLSGFFAYSHFKIGQSEKLHFFFDADYFEAKADIDYKNGNLDESLNELKKAIFYRPKDYQLWMKSAQISERQNDFPAAEESFRQAIELAPFYGEPRFEFGNFLLKNNQKQEGLEQLAFVFPRDLRYSDLIIETVWKETGGDAEKTLELLSPLSESQKDKLARFLLRQNLFSELIPINCAGKFSPGVENMLVKRLFEKKQFRFAWQIFRKDCGADNSQKNGLMDGDFESGELRRGFGFGWRVGDSVEKTNLRFDEENAVSGKQSLQFILEGTYKTPLISQIVAVEKNADYQLDFSYKSEKTGAGNFPVLQIILRRSDSETKIKEIELREENLWSKPKIEFQTDDQTEAVEIRIAVNNCGKQICPVYRNLWIDDFKLSENNSE